MLMTNPENNEEPKIIVDDDYKSQVEAEKEAIKQALEEKANENAASDIDGMEMPPASIPMLVTTLATQALSNLGHIPDPIEGKPVIRKQLAKHFIDTLAVLEEKTKGNLSDDENEMLNGTLHQLRMAFVATPESMPEAPAAATESKPSSIELPS